MHRPYAGLRSVPDRYQHRVGDGVGLTVAGLGPRRRLGPYGEPLGVHRRRELLRGEHDAGHRPAQPGVLVVGVVAGDEQRAAGGDRRGHLPGGVEHPVVEQVQEAGRDEVPLLPLRGPGPQVGLAELDPVGDPALLRVLGGLAQPRLGEVDRRHLPALLGQPDRVAPLTTAQVDGSARRQVGRLGDQDRVRPAAPGATLAGVPLVPRRLLEVLAGDLAVALVLAVVVAHADFLWYSSTAAAVSSSMRSMLIMAPAFRPPAAAEMTCARRSVTLPATHTPGTVVRPLGSDGTAYPKTTSFISTAAGSRPSEESRSELATNFGPATSASSRTTSPDCRRTPARRSSSTTTSAIGPPTTVTPRAASFSASTGDSSRWS